MREIMLATDIGALGNKKETQNWMVGVGVSRNFLNNLIHL